MLANIVSRSQDMDLQRWLTRRRWPTKRTCGYQRQNGRSRAHVRSRSWAQDSQNENTCSMRLQSSLKDMDLEITAKYYAAMTAPKGSPSVDVFCLSQPILLVQHSTEGFFRLITEAVQHGSFFLRAATATRKPPQRRFVAYSQPYGPVARQMLMANYGRTHLALSLTTAAA